MKGVSREATDTPARENGVNFDEDALQYLALAAESRLGQLLSQTLAVQTHRTTTNHLRPAPLDKNGKASWDHVGISDPTAILEAINRQNKETEQSFRADRMTRLAKETEVQRARERLVEREEEDTGVDNNVAGPSTPMRSNTNPTFGGVPTLSSDKKKKSGKKTLVTAEVQHKMSNMTAMRSIGGGKKYSWMSSSPSVSSPLAGKKRKKEESGSTLNPNNTATDQPDDTGPNVKKEEMEKEHQPSPVISTPRPKKRKHRIKLTDPSRRQVVVSRENGVERRQTDDRVLTVQDVLFVLERDGVGRGMGTGDDLVRRLWALGGMGQKGQRS